MINRNQRIDTSRLRRLQFYEMKPALVVRQCIEKIAHQSNRRLMKINNLYSGNHPQQFKAGLNDALDARMLMQCDLEGNWPTQHWPQVLEASCQKQHERCHLEWPRAAHLLDRRQRRFGELHMATGAPGDDAGLSFGKFVERIVATRPDTSTSPARAWTM